MRLVITLLAALFSGVHLQESQDPDVVDLAILMDSSITRSKFQTMTNYIANDLLDSLNIQNSRMRIAIVNFGPTIQILYRFKQDQQKETIKAAVKNAIHFGGVSDLSQALTDTRRTIFTTAEGERTNARNLAILFTNGASPNFGRSLRSAMLLKTAGVGIVVVTVGSFFNEIELNEVASDPKDSNVIAANNFESATTDKLRTLIRDQTRRCQSDPCENGASCQNMPSNYICFCQPNFAGRRCQYRSNRNYDIVISVDSSTSIKKENFFTLLGFVRYLTGSMPISNSRFRLGLQTFSTAEIKRFDLNEFESTFAAFQAINFPYELGHTDTAQAFKAIRENMFVSGLGDRSNAENVVIYFSDGHSKNRSSTFDEAAQLHASGIRVITVGVVPNGNTFNKRELEGIASNPDSSNLFIVNDYSDLKLDLADNIIQKLVDDNNECSSNPCQNGDCVVESGTYRCICDPLARSGKNCDKDCFGLNDIIFALDTSNSIRRNRMPILKNVVKSIIDQSNVHTPTSSRVGVISFSDTPRIEFHLNSYVTAQDIKQRIDTIKFTGGKTNIADTFGQVRQMFTTENGTRDTAQKFLYIITDSQPTINVNQTTAEAVLTRISGVTIIVIAPEQKRERLWLKAISSQPYERFIYTVDRYSQLPSITTAASNAICDSVNECDTTNCQNGGQCANSFGRIMCFCTQRFTGDRCERECTSSQDVVFILDRSGSVESFFEIQMKLARKIVWGLNFNGGRSRVGVVTFSDTAKTEFYMDAYTDTTFPPPIRPKLHVLDAIAFTKSEDKKTNIASALEFTRTEMFRSDRGDRGTRNIAILMTDGKPNLAESRTSAEASSLKGSNVRLMTIGIGSNINTAILDDAASSPTNNNRFNLNNEQQITNVAEQVLNEICN